MTIVDLDARRAAIEATRDLAEAMKPQPYRVPEERLIREPGVYPDVTMRDYLADPVAGGSLSRSTAKTILLPAGPARLRWSLDHPQERHSAAFDLGKAAHQVVLGDSENHVKVIDGPKNAAGNTEWRSDALKRAVAEARKAGLTPIRPEVWEQVQAMAEAIQAHPRAAALLQSAAGKPEQTLVWQDNLTGVWCRVRFDYFRSVGSRLVIVDYKTTAQLADAEDIGRESARYRYFLQDAFYCAGAAALDLDDSPEFLLIVQETDPPYLVNVVGHDDTARTLGRNLMRSALNIYAECSRTGEWPGYGKEIAYVSLPPWFLRGYGEEPA